MQELKLANCRWDPSKTLFEQFAAPDVLPSMRDQDMVSVHAPDRRLYLLTKL